MLMRQVWIVIKRLFRSPKVILGELAALTCACAVGAALGLEKVFHSAGFFVLMAAISLSLVIVVGGQGHRLISQWPKQRAAGLLGSPLFHLGLLLVIVAGVCRALFGAEAVVDLVEGETLAAPHASWAAQHPGLLGGQFQLSCPVTLNSVGATRYPDGDLQKLTATLTVRHATGAQVAELAVNHDLKNACGRLFVGSEFGPAALVEWRKPDSSVFREAVLMADCGHGLYEGSSSGSNGLQAHVRAYMGNTAKRPDHLELRIMRQNALLFTGNSRVGQAVRLQGGGSLALLGVPLWVRLRGSHDPGLWLAYAGFILIMAGAVLLFAVAKPGQSGVPA